MLDFRRHQRAPLRFGLRTERRLLMVLCGSALVVLLVLGVSGPHRAAPQAPQRAAPPRMARIGELVLADAGNNDDSRRGDDDTKPLFPGVRPDYLAHVRDDTVFRAAEKDAWFHLLVVLEQSNAAELGQASTGSVGYLQLDEQPDAYRGRLVTISGVVRSAKRITAPENGFGIEDYYQLWLQPERSQEQLVVVYTLDVPRDFPLGPELDTECTTTGFFFKRWAYQAQEGILTAPLILSKTIEWKPPAQPLARPPVGESLVFSVAVAAVLALILLGFVVARGRRARRFAGADDAIVSLDRLPVETRD